jgi:hypothetical protein
MRQPLVWRSEAGLVLDGVELGDPIERGFGNGRLRCLPHVEDASAAVGPASDLGDRWHRGEFGPGFSTPNKRSEQFQAEVVKSGCTPLEHMLTVLHDESADKDRRDRMAVAAAPYIHPKLQVVDSTVRAVVDVTPLTAEERRQRARAAILEAFRERPPRVVEGEYRVIAGKDVSPVAANCGEPVNDEASEEREG